MTAVRRVKLLAIATLTTLILLLWYSTQTRSDRRFDHQTHVADYNRHKQDVKNGHLDFEDADIERKLKSQRLQEAEKAAKDRANEKAPNPPAGLKAAVEEEEDTTAKGGKWDANVEIDRILKRSPIIIFSKTYCPYSKKAKKLLLETYKITPTPFVVEIDEHPHGLELQNAVGVQTKRTTVPNIMILGKSIGGSDEVAALEKQGTLVSTVMALAGKRIISMEKA